MVIGSSVTTQGVYTPQYSVEVTKESKPTVDELKQTLKMQEKYLNNLVDFVDNRLQTAEDITGTDYTKGSFLDVSV